MSQQTARIDSVKSSSNINALSTWVASNRDDKKAFQTAFYVTLLLLLLGVCMLGAFAVYQMLYMFLTPILWSTLIGTVLFPLKRKISIAMKGWVDELRSTHTPLTVGCLMLPWRALSNISEVLWQLLISRTGVYIAIVFVILKILNYERTFVAVLALLGRAYGIVDRSIVFCANKSVIMIVYVCAYGGWIYLCQPNKKFARTISLPIWLFVLSLMAEYFGPLRVIVFSAVALLLAAISLGFVANDESNEESETKVTSTLEEKPIETKQVDDNDQALDEMLTSDTYLQMIACLCFMLLTARHNWVLMLVLSTLLIAVMRKSGELLGIVAGINQLIESIWSNASLRRIVDVTVVGSIRKFFRVLFTTDRKLIDAFERYMDVFSSIVVMIMLAFGSLFFAIFVAFQLHGETVHLVKLSSNVLSSRPSWIAYAVNYTEDQLSEHNVDEYMEQAYTQGRAFLASNVRSLISTSDPDRADMLEEQVKVIVDKLYAMWEQRNTDFIISRNENQSVLVKPDYYLSLQHATNLVAFKDELIQILKDNVDTLLSIAQSIWTVLSANVTFLTSIVAALLSLVLGFGLDLLHLIIEMVVFMTIVYYLLVNSHDQWLPLKWITAMLPASNTNVDGQPQSSLFSADAITTAIERVICGVFILSIKMSIFYGLYTWFIHTLFDLNIVFVPSMLAALFASVPLVAPYFVCVIGIVELWLVRGETTAALIFAIASFAPVVVVDAAFYKEVKSSHPYITGLAIIGGMYWLGLQGAIIGPIILCCLLVMLNVYAKFASSN